MRRPDWHNWMQFERGLSDLAGLRERHALLRAAALLIPGDTPRLDAELLLAYALGEERLGMLMGSAPLSADVVARFCALVARRCTCEPVAHLVGRREFWSLPLAVSPDVLVPRPDSETLLSEALVRFVGRSPRLILDLGTGSGALLLAALSQWREAVGLGVDRSAAAIAMARANAEGLGFGERASFIVGDWADALDARFDLVLCNPPYIPEGTPLMADVALFEPALALFGGADGLAPYRRLFPGVSRLLAPSGAALFEFGDGQAGALLEMADGLGLHAQIANDLAGRPRVIILTAAPVPPIGLGKTSGSV